MNRVSFTLTEIKKVLETTDSIKINLSISIKMIIFFFDEKLIINDADGASIFNINESLIQI